MKQLTKDVSQRERGPLGRATSKRILAAARRLLIEEGYAHFTMRSVATKAGMRLGNLQYYFRTPDDLVRGLMYDTGERYQAIYDRVLAGALPDPEARFKAVLDANLKDISNPQTRRFFTSLWALLNDLDGNSNELLSELYRIDIEQLNALIAPLDPEASPDETRQRATLLAAMIEGLHVVQGAHSRRASDMKKLVAQARVAALGIATGKWPDGMSD